MDEFAKMFDDDVLKWKAHLEKKLGQAICIVKLLPDISVYY